MKTTLENIREHLPCSDGWAKLLTYLGKTKADDEPLSVVTILDSNGLDDALWALRAVDGHDREPRLYAVWCARRVQHLMTDQRSIDALDVAEQHAKGQATDEQLAAARSAAEAAWASSWAASEAADAAAEAAAWTAAEAASRGAVWAAGAAARAVEGAAEIEAQAAELRRVCECIEVGIDPYPREG